MLGNEKIIKDKKLWVYDLETFANFFSGVFINESTGEMRSFICHGDRNELPEMIKFLLDKNVVKGLIGFNNINFDYPVLHFILTKQNQFRNRTGDSIAKLIKKKSQEIIEAEYSSISSKLVKIPQLDLYKIYHFDNKAKVCSLKWCEFAMRWKRLQDLPFKHDDFITDDDIDEVMDYNLNDVLATLELYGKSHQKIKLRKGIGKKYKLNLINANDPKIGSEIFAKILCERKGITRHELNQMRTYRDEIKLDECILPYVKFKSEGFNALLDFLKQQTITETKGFFSDIPIRRCSKELLTNVSPDSLKKGLLTKLNVFHKGLQYDYGTGGLKWGLLLGN